MAVRSRQLHHHFANVISGEEADESTFGLVEAFDNQGNFIKELTAHNA